MARWTKALTRAEWIRLSGFAGGVLFLHLLGWGLFLWYARHNPAHSFGGTAKSNRSRNDTTRHTTATRRCVSTIRAKRKRTIQAEERSDMSIPRHRSANQRQGVRVEWRQGLEQLGQYP